MKFEIDDNVIKNIIIIWTKYIINLKYFFQVTSLPDFSFDEAEKLYIASAGPIIDNGFEVSLFLILL